MIFLTLISRKCTHGLVITRFPLQTGWGGEERLHLFLAEELQRNGIETHLFTPDADLKAGFLAQGFSVTSAIFAQDITSKKNLLLFPLYAIPFLLQGIYHLIRLRRRGYKTILMLTLIEKVVLTPFALVFGYRIIWAHHAKIGKWLTKNPFYFKWRYWSTFVTLITPSQEMARQLQKATPQAKVITIHNPLLPFAKPGADFRKVRRIKKDKPIIISIGRVSAEKRFDLVLQTAKLIPEAMFVISGVGNTTSLKRQIDDLNLKNVLLTEFLDSSELSALYSSADLYLSCSEYESFGLTLLEAQSFGVPIVSYKTGGIPEVVKHNFSGILLGKNEPQAFAAEIRNLLSDKKYYQRLQKGAKQQASQFSPEVYLQKMKAVLFK